MMRSSAVLAFAAVLVAGCATLLPQPQKFSDHATKLREYAALSQALYAPARPLANGAIFEVRYEGLLVQGRTKYALVTDDAARHHEIAIQGTGSAVDLGTGLDFVPTYDRPLDMDLHSGFRSVALAVRGDVLPRLKPGYSIGIAGHSAGGAAAQILALYLALVDKRTVTEVYTFGQPKFGAPKGRSLNALADRTVRVVNCDDAVPMLPNPVVTGSLVAPYRGSGPVVFLAQDGRVWFSRDEVELDNLETLGRNVVRDLLVGKPFRAHLMETYVERLAKAVEDPAATDYGADAKYICS